MAEEPKPKTMLKKEDWGLLTITALLSTFIFPPYFIHLMAMAALTEFAHLWTTRLSQKDQERFIEFEKEFRVGYKLEKAGKRAEALKRYRSLLKRYRGLRQAEHLLSLQIGKLTQSDKSGPSPKPADAGPKKGRG
jgi:hypothetical protein